MTKLLQTLVDGVAVGSLYGLIALGYTMVYGILKFINFAHSDVFTFGAWIALVAAVAAGWTGQAAPLPAWLFYGLGGVLILAIAALGYERLLASRERLAWLPRTRIGGTLVLLVVWGAASAALVPAARWVKLGLGLDWLSGLVILVLSMSLAGLLGFTVERLAYRPLRQAPRLNVLITAIGVSLFLQNTGQLQPFFGTQPRSMPPLLPDRVLFSVHEQVESAGSAPAQARKVDIRLVDVTVTVTALVLMAALQWLVHGTKLGLGMRAVSFDTRIASLMGIPVDRVISFTFVVGSSLAAAAGFLYANKYPGLNQPAHATWILLGLKAFVAAVVGGIGNIRGAMLGGLMIGLIEFFGKAYLHPHLADLYVFSILIIVLLVKPTGVLGRRVAEKV